MTEFTLNADIREITGKKVNQLRNQGLVPATIYGPNIQPVNVQIPYRPLEVMLMKAGGTNLINIVVGGKTHSVLARSVQRHTIRRTIMHVDFMAVDVKSKIRTEVPLQFVGESAAVAGRRGILVTGTTTVTVEALPADLVNVIEVDLSVLNKVGMSIHIGDLQLPPKVELVNDPEELVVRVQQTSAARAEEEEEAEAEMTSAEPEVIHKGKEEEEDF